MGERFNAVELTPLTVDVRLVPLRDNALLFTIDAVAATPLVVFVIILVALLSVLVIAAVIAGVRFKPEEATPFTVEVRVDPDKDKAVVLTAGAVDVIPLTEEVIVFAGLVNALLLIIDTPVAAIPFTVVVSVLVELVLPMVFTIGAVAGTPLVVLVVVVSMLTRVLVVAPMIPVARLVHTGEAAVPVFTLNAFSVVL